MTSVALTGPYTPKNRRTLMLVLSICTILWPYVLRLVGVPRNSASRTSMVVHSCEFCLALADPLAHVPSYISSWRHWRGADAPSLLAEFYGSHSKSSLLHQPLKATERWCCTPRCISLRNRATRSERSLPGLTRTQLTYQLPYLRSNPTRSHSSLENPEEPMHPLLTKGASHAIRRIAATRLQAGTKPPRAHCIREKSS